MRKFKKIVTVGKVKIGGRNPIVVQSMTKTPTSDRQKTLNQIRRLEKAGCELVRLAVVNQSDIRALRWIRGKTKVPIIADIHFDYRLALDAIDCGVDKIRINPGNIGENWKLIEVIKKAGDRGLPIRIGVNAGSLPKSIIKKYKHPTPAAIVQTIKQTLSVFNKHNFNNIVISAKNAEVKDTVIVYERLNSAFDYPLHIGITEAGLPFQGGIKSAVGLGILLDQYIGDTIRVSLTGDPVREVVAAYEILSAIGIRRTKPVLISCPTCGRCQVSLIKIAKAVEERLRKYRSYIKVAVMGCVVNGPGEAREADFGIACGKHIGLIFAKGKEIKRVKENRLVDELFEVIDENINNR
jgi:(E)-4-hydroxy-3-methylbut-2-enyl-diphosphate synthase